MYAVAKHGKDGKSLFFGPANKGAPWHRNAEFIKDYRCADKAADVAARCGGWVVDADHARWNCGERSVCTDMLG